MNITAADLSNLYVGYSTRFNGCYLGEPTPLLDKIGTVVPSSTRTNKYPFAQAISGAMREWLGERRTQNIVVDDVSVTNALWENTLAIKRVDLEDDQYGVYSSMMIPMLARNAKLLPDRQIALAIENNAVGFDGVTFFSASHPIDPSGLTTGTQSNTQAALPLNGTNLSIVQAKMRNFKGPDNQPMGSMGSILLVPPSLQYAADILANGTFFPEAQNGNSAVFGSTSNPWRGQYQVVTSEWLTDSGDPATAVWYLLDCRYPELRPFFWQERVAPQLVALIDPANTAVFFQDIFYMGARSRGAAAAGPWFKAFRCNHA
jgi:phage major head subunit gpT-like protein